MKRSRPLHASVRSVDELWTGEVKTTGHLTAYTPGAEEQVLADFERAVAGRDDTTVWMNALGRLLHRAPGTTTPRWYGHWQMDDGFHELVEIRLSSVDGGVHELEVLFPVIGYPAATAANRISGQRSIARTRARHRDQRRERARRRCVCMLASSIQMSRFNP
jgi:hypothetical protein